MEVHKKSCKKIKKTTPDQTRKKNPSACSKNKGITNFLICGSLTFAQHLLNGNRIAQICQVYQQIRASLHTAHFICKGISLLLLYWWKRVLGDWDSAGYMGNMYFILCELNQGWNLKVILSNWPLKA